MKKGFQVNIYCLIKLFFSSFFKGLAKIIPALFTKMSGEPTCSIDLLTNKLQFSLEDMSKFKAKHFLPKDKIYSSFHQNYCHHLDGKKLC